MCADSSVSSSQTLPGILAILGDQADLEYPIFHDYKSRPKEAKGNSWTLCTVVTDIESPGKGRIISLTLTLESVKKFETF